jgi:hypothetical protein
MDVLNTISNNPYYDTAISDVQPTLNLDFANAKTLDSRITFSRPTTATYYDAKTSAVAEQNLLLQSQTFNTTWATQAITLTANSTTAPDGTSTAYTATVNATSVEQRVRQSTSQSNSTVYTYSVYAKANTVNFISLRNYYLTASPVQAWFNLGTGALGTVQAGVTATITSVGSGWYRCTVSGTTGNPGTFNGVDIYPAAADNQATNAGSIGDSIYIWGAQLEQRSSVTAYNATTTAAITNYIPVLQTASTDTARLDYNPITRLANGLLIEEQRTNLLTYSQLFSSWAATNNITVTSSANIAPDGTQSAGLFTVTTANGNHNVINNTTGITVALSPLTATFYAKVGTSNIVGIDIKHTDATQGRAYFNLSTLSSTVVYGASTSTSITAVGNGWYRCSFTVTPSSTVATFALYVCNSSNAFSYTGAGESAFFADCQLEQGAFATSYIPTVASQVTRSADSASIARASWFNISQGTFYAEVLAGKSSTSGGYGATNCFVVSSNSASPERLGIYFDSGTACTINTYNGTNSYTATSSTVTAGVFHKVSSFYETSGIGMVADAGTVASTSGILPVYQTFTNLNIGQNYVTGGNFLNGYMKKLAYYPIRLTNAELQEMTL